MHAPLHHDYLVPLLRGAAFCFLVFFFWAGSRQSCAFRCVSVSSPAVACLSSIVAGCPRPWGIVVVEADVGRALLLFVRLRGFGTQAPFLGVLRTFPLCHRSPQIGHTLGLSIPSVAALLLRPPPFFGCLLADLTPNHLTLCEGPGTSIRNVS